jgi:succinyl-diaminopimelate desuccinylase
VNLLNRTQKAQKNEKDLMTTNNLNQQLDTWIDQHFDEEVKFLQALIQVPTDTPPGNNTPHALRTTELLQGMGLQAEQHAPPAQLVKDAGLQSITNLIVRRKYGDGGKTIALNAHGDVVPPGEGWSVDPYGGVLKDGFIYGRAAAVSKCDFATFTFALRALEAMAKPSKGAIELHFTYDEEFGGEVGPAWLLSQGLTKPDLMIAAGFSYQVVVAHNGCLQMEVTVQGEMSHAAIPDSSCDALQGAVHILAELYKLNAEYKKISSKVVGITHPYLNIGQIEGGTNTNVVPGKVTFKLDRRMIPEENSAEVEQSIRDAIANAAASYQPARGSSKIAVNVKRILLAEAMKPLPGSAPLVKALQEQGKEVFGETIPALGTPLYTDVRIYGQHGIPGVIYGAGPRTVLESNAKRADERLNLEDLRRATKVIARVLHQILM